MSFGLSPLGTSSLATAPPTWLAPPEEPELPEQSPLGGLLVGMPSVQLQSVAGENLPYSNDAQLFVINRNPEPDEVEVAHETLGQPTPIVLQLIGHDGPPAIDRVRILLDDELVMAGGTFSEGYAGTYGVIGGAALQVALWRLTPFESAQRVGVRVQQLLGGAGGYLDDVASWAFTWTDESRPRVADVSALDVQAVLVFFSEPVLLESALDPQRYTLTRVSAVAALPEVVEVVNAGAPDAVQVVFDQPLTFGATYTLHVSGVTDRYGNLIDPTYRTITFQAFSPPIPEGRRFQLWDFIPGLHKRADKEHDDELYRFVSVLQEPTNVLLYEIDRFAALSDGDQAPEPFVDAMLADFGCPFDISELSLGEKRKLLSVLIRLYQQKGTTEGLIDAARTLLGLEIAVHPLNEGGWQLGVHELGNWETTWLGPETSFQRFAFEVTVFTEIGRDLSDVERARLIEIIHVMRPAHTHFRRLNEMPIGYPEA